MRQQQRTSVTTRFTHDADGRNDGGNGNLTNVTGPVDAARPA